MLAASCEREAPAATPSKPARSPSTAAATEPPIPQPDELLVAYLYDREVDALDAASTAPYQAAQLAFEAASSEASPAAVELAAIDVSDRSADEISATIREDEAYVAAVVAPRVIDQAAIVDALDVPVVSLSSRDRVASEPGAWRRLVPTTEQLGMTAGAWAVALGGDDVCVVPSPSDGSRFATAAARAVRDAGGDVLSIGGGDAGVDQCGAIVWTTGYEDAVVTLHALGRPRPSFIGGPELRAPDFLETAGAAANGVGAVCACADVSTSLRLADQRFVQVFQAEHGAPPGPGAVEAWDAANLLVDAIAAAGPSRDALATSVASRTRFDGLGGTYVFAPNGELEDPADHTFRYRVEGGRWVDVTPRRSAR
ncbi:MAG TPA: ABC transporter substrate-binding protein [Actinomycetota bacterium]|nr:ABC transporter substrate-binding protein [Actinomycetota bacterium]